MAGQGTAREADDYHSTLIRLSSLIHAAARKNNPRPPAGSPAATRRQRRQGQAGSGAARRPGLDYWDRTIALQTQRRKATLLTGIIQTTPSDCEEEPTNNRNTGYRGWLLGRPTSPSLSQSGGTNSIPKGMLRCPRVSGRVSFGVVRLQAYLRKRELKPTPSSTHSWATGA